jgi:hypothetical protein
VFLTEHPHVQGLVLGVALLAAAAVATPTVIDAARDLSHMPPPALAQGSAPAPDAPTTQSDGPTAQPNAIGKVLNTPLLAAKVG